MTAKPKYPVRLTLAQRRITLDVLAAIANDPDWVGFTGAKDWDVYVSAVETLGTGQAPRLTGAELRVLRSVLAVVLNAPDIWADYVGGPRSWPALGRAYDAITAAHVTASRAEVVR